METISPPMTPNRMSLSPLNTSPTYSYREQLQRRHSSFSSHNDRSPISIRKQRFSNGSQYSNDFSPDIGGGGGGEGMGNLADELDQMDEDIGDEGDTTEVTGEVFGDGGGEDAAAAAASSSPGEGARDSGIDVSYNSSKKVSPRMMRNFSKPFSAAPEKPPDEGAEDQEEDEEDKLSPELEDAMSSIARMTSYTSTAVDPLIPRTIDLLQDLGNQSTLEASMQRSATFTNSMTAHLAAQTKAIQTLATSLYSPFLFSAPLDLAVLEDTTPLVEELMKQLPLPDPAPLQGMHKLDRDTRSLVHTLSQLTDTLQMGKQATNTASRHLRTTQTIVAELRRERERAEVARFELGKTDWEDGLRERRCARECKDVLDGFERTCDSLRASME